MAEITRYGLAGNQSHMVITLEGIYVCQVNPCFKKILKKLTPEERGVISYLIETHFAAFHTLRTYKNVARASKGGIKVNPQWFTHYVNSFTFNKIKKVPLIVNNKIKTEDITNYIGKTSNHYKNIC